MTRRHVLVKGRVQGIGYRWFVQSTAEELELGGWVRNLPDGDVELEAEGDPAKLKLFLEKLRTGHRWARVEELKVDDRPEKGDSRFEILGG
jgi:acylphosphatase